MSPEKQGAAFGQASIVDVAVEDSVLRYTVRNFFLLKLVLLSSSFVLGFTRWLSDQRVDQLVLLILILALTIKFTFFDDRTHQTSTSLKANNPPTYNSIMTESSAASVAEISIDIQFF